jgi:hypothetical protein
MMRPPIMRAPMMRLTTRHLAALLLAVLPVMAAAQPAPRIRPSRDVVVTYQVDGQALSLVPGGIQGPVTLSWDAAGERLRAEVAGRSQVALIDLHSHAGQAIDTTLRIVLPLPIRQQDLQPLTLDGARLVPAGKDQVAGLACNRYTFDSPQGPGTVCLTPDGVPLRGQGSVSGKPGSFAATAVHYGPIPAERFTVPPGYMALGGTSGGSPSQGGASGGLAGLVQKFGGGASLNDLKSLLGRGK